MNKDRFKFRGWDKPSYDFPEGCMTYFDIHKGIGDCDVIMQCTGLKDKNDKLIYEGDIVSFLDEKGSKQIGQVNWCEFAYYAEAIDGDEEGNQDIELHPDYLQGIEIIGNIYENPELLTNDK
jgi:uncharacterized phage protein (TIGR01671 family)